MRRRNFVTYCEYVNSECPEVCEPNKRCVCNEENAIVNECECNMVLKSKGSQCLKKGGVVRYDLAFHNTDCPIRERNGIVSLLAGAYCINFSCIWQNGIGCEVGLYLNNNLVLSSVVCGSNCICITDKLTVRCCQLSIKCISEFINFSNAILSIVRLY